MSKRLLTTKTQRHEEIAICVKNTCLSSWFPCSGRRISKIFQLTPAREGLVRLCIWINEYKVSWSGLWTVITRVRLTKPKWSLTKQKMKKIIKKLASVIFMFIFSLSIFKKRYYYYTILYPVQGIRLKNKILISTDESNIYYLFS